MHRSVLDPISRKYMRRGDDSVPPVILDFIARYVKERSYKLVAALHQNTSAETLDFLADYKERWRLFDMLFAQRVRATVALNPNAEPHTIVKLSKDKSYQVLFNVSLRHYFGMPIPVDAQINLAACRYPNIKKVVIDYHDVDMSVLRLLKTDLNVGRDADAKISEIFRRNTRSGV
jgi:hypothetical protein